ncbi:AMP-binding protein [Spirillospora sp. NPDC047279]|uniref:AMP-binding protein n=1 Tax=Spirillospora sp. NPDC047279 TaxID=3155478 RepID=UPI0033D9BEC0
MESLWDALLAAERGRLHCWTGAGFTTVTWPDVVAGARRMVAGLRRAGVGPGTTVPVVLTNTMETVQGTLAVWLAGGAVASLPVPARGMEIDAYVRQIDQLCRQLGGPLLLADGAMLPALPEPTRAALRATAWQSLVDSGTAEETPPGDDELAFVQYSSGSVGRPKGCMLTPRAISAQLDVIMKMTAAQGEEIVSSWLPLSHDMGMFGCLLFSWAYDSSLVLSTPERFTLSAGTWFGDMADFGATMTAGTNTGLHLATLARRRRLRAPLALRCAVIGAERIERRTLQAACAAFAEDGLRPDALMPAYGLAEATLAVTAAPAGTAPRFITVDPIRLAGNKVSMVPPGDPVATTLVSCGRPAPGIVLGALPADALGEVVVRSPSLASGYHGDPELTRQRFAADGLHTGDLAFVGDGELYLVGRLDDLVSVGGRNVYTREIELAVDTLAPVRRGCSTIIDLGGPDTPGRLVLVTELRNGTIDYQSVADDVAAIAMAKAGVEVGECVFVRRGAVPKTPSGKIQRYRCRQLLMADALPTVATVGSPS